MDVRKIDKKVLIERQVIVTKKEKKNRMANRD